MTAGDLEIQFLGGASAIGASSALVRAGGVSLLIDCGVRFSPGDALPDLAQLTGRELDAVLVTHAHSDHTGALPVVHQSFPVAPIYATPPTLDLVRILQRDALRLMKTKADQEGELPLYSEAQVDGMLQAVVPVHHGESIEVGDVRVTYLPAAHILGASMVHLATPAGNVLFTGDFSVSAQRTVPALDPPRLPVDLVVTESTYGDRMHADRSAEERRLLNQLNETIAEGGRVLVPAFAIGRAQEILSVLRQAMADGDVAEVPVFVDGMVRAVCDVYASHERYATRALAHAMRGGHPFYDDRIRAVRDRADRKSVLDAGPCVIVSSSGMLAGGPSASYAAALAPNARDTILITGYQDEESPGRALLRLTETSGPRRLRLPDGEVDVACRFDRYGLSAHADRIQLAGLMESLGPRTVVLVHGDREARRSLQQALSAGDVVIAHDGDTVSRRYPLRRASGVAIRDIGPEQARALLAPFAGRRVRAAQVARGWLGGGAGHSARERLVARLESYGLVRRDDEDRGLLHVEDVTGEDALEEQLKRQNPKGKLLELCMRTGVEPPERRSVPAGGRHRVELTVYVDGRQLASGPHEASSRKTAEQLAARALLEAVHDRPSPDGEPAGDVTDVDEARAERLKHENPKGRLLERLAAQRLPPPDFELLPSSPGCVVRARLDALGLETGAFRAARRKVAEQAAAADLLSRLEGGGGAAPAGEPPAQGTEGAMDPTEGLALPPQPAEATAGRDPRSLLNELRQVGVIDDYGLELVESRGPSHRPAFVVVGRATLPGGDVVSTAELEGPSKKAAQRTAAGALIEELDARRYA